MSRHTLARLALLATTAFAGITAGVVVAPAAHAEPTCARPVLPDTAMAPLHAVPWTVAHGRKLR